MASPTSAWLGPGLILLFCLSQAFRDVYFGNAFQGVDYFAVILLAFSASTVIFTAIPLARDPAAFKALYGQLGAVLSINITTALAWSCYFFGLSRIEPSVVNTLHSGMGPLTVIALAAFGARLARTKTVSRGEYASYAGIAVSMLGLGWVVVSGRSGMIAASEVEALFGLAALVVSGTSITISLLYCKRLHDRGVSTDVITAVRYLLLIVVAGAVVWGKGGMAGVRSGAEAAGLAAIATVLIVLPLYAFQVGVALTTPMTTNVLKALGPVFIFALQQADGRLVYSTDAALRPRLLCRGDPRGRRPRACRSTGRQVRSRPAMAQRRPAAAADTGGGAKRMTLVGAAPAVGP